MSEAHEKLAEEPIEHPLKEIDTQIYV